MTWWISLNIIRWEKKMYDHRHVIQIFAVSQGIYALCGDGTIWFRYHDRDWFQIKGIPQENKERNND